MFNKKYSKYIKDARIVYFTYQIHQNNHYVFNTMIDFSRFRLQTEAFSQQSFNIIKPEDKGIFSLLMEIILLETGSRIARENWQSAQLVNLFTHANARSKFWQERFKGKKIAQLKLSKLPPLTREDVRKQVEAEGSLIREQDGVPFKTHSTSGSTGTPVTFYITQSNGIYNEVRSFAQYLMENRDLSWKRLRLNQFFYENPQNIQYEEFPHYGGSLSKIFSTGRNANLYYNVFDREAFIKKAAKFRGDFWVLGAPVSHSLPTQLTAKECYDLGARLWIIIGTTVPDALRQDLKSAGIEVLSNYSSEEVGLIGTECIHKPGHFHVTSSNVIVEQAGHVVHDGIDCGRLLVTHLNSYATPFIRYDIGDIGRVKDECPCGFKGQTISHLFGRMTATLRNADGTRSGIMMRATELNKLVPVKEFRVRQVDFKKIIFEVVTQHQSADTEKLLRGYIHGLIGPDFDVDVVFYDKINWGPTVQRHGFRCEID